MPRTKKSSKKQAKSPKKPQAWYLLVPEHELGDDPTSRKFSAESLKEALDLADTEVADGDDILIFKVMRRVTLPHVDPAPVVTSFVD